MTENRIARELNNRESAQRKRTWQPAETLPTPAPSGGYVFRWIRTAVTGQADPTNVSAKFREGWEPVRAEDHPELAYQAQADNTARYKGNVEVGGLLLCRAPEDLMQQRDEFFMRKARSQMEAVDNSYLRTNDPRMPMDALMDNPIQRSTKVTKFGRSS